MGSLLIVTGPPGAGKSTVARLLADTDGPSVLVAGDAFFGFLAAGAIEPWLPASKDQNRIVARAAALATAAFVAGGYTTVYDGVLGPWSIDGFLADAGLDHADYAVLLPPLERCLARVATRTGHEFDDPAATAKMHHEFSAAGLDPRHVLGNPDVGDADDGQGPAGPAETAAAIRSLAADGRLRYDLPPGGGQSLPSR